MLPLGGAVTFSSPLPAVNDSPTSLCSISNAWVGAPGRIRTTELIFAASGVCTWKLLPYVRVAGVTPVMAGRVARLPSGLNRYAGE